MAVPMKTQIRKAIIDILIDDSATAFFGPDPGDSGVAGWDKINVHDSPQDAIQTFCHPDPQPASGNPYGLPAVAVYTGRDEYNIAEFASVEACIEKDTEIDIEIYGCASKSFELEALMDILESQVLYKVLNNKKFRKLVEKILSLSIVPFRDAGEDGRYQMRRITMRVKNRTNYSTNIPTTEHCAKFVYVIGADPDTGNLTTGDVHA